MLVKTIISLFIISSHLLSANNHYNFNTPNTSLNCDIEFDYLFVGECDSTGRFEFSFSATSLKSSAGTYFLSINGIIILEEIPYDSIMSITLTSNAFGRSILAYDTSNPECNDFYVFDDIECEEYNCTLGNSNLLFDCIDDSLYQVTADVLYSGQSDSLLLHFYSDESYFPIFTQLYAVSDFPVVLDTFSPSNTLYYHYITEPNDPFCSTGNEWNDAPNCMSGCELSNLVIEVSTCEDSSAYLDLFFDYDSIGDYGFHIRTKTQHFGYNFEYGEDFFTIGPISADCETLHEISIIDNEHHACYTTLTLDEPLCCEEGECLISDVYAEAYECEDSLFYVDIEFNSNNTGESGFEIRGNGISYGDSFNYGQIFYTVGPIVADCETVLEFIIIDNDDPNCNNFFGFEEPICCEDETECDMRDIEIELGDCNEDGTYAVTVDFIHEGTTNEFFDVWAGDEYIGFYRFDQLPIEIDTFYPRDVEYDLIRICENDNPECCAIAEFMGPDCEEEDECDMRDIEIELGDCNEDGTYAVTVDFIYEGTTNEFFDVWAGDEYIGFYRFDQLPIAIDTFYPRDVEYDLIRICENDNPECCAIAEFMGPECEEMGNCNISDVFAEAYECEDSLFYLDVIFEVNNPGELGFEIRGNGVSYGDNFEYGEEYYTIGPLVADCETVLELIIIDNENSACTNFFGFEEPICCEEETCILSEIIADPLDCNEDGSYSLYIDFEYEGTSNEYFDVWTSEEYIGFYKFEDLPFIIDTIYPRDAEYDFIQICENDNPECCIEHEYLSPDCDMLDSTTDLDNSAFSIFVKNSILNVVNLNASDFNVSLFDINGRTIVNSIQKQNHYIDTSAIPAGCYLIHIQGLNRSYSQLIFL